MQHRFSATVSSVSRRQMLHALSAAGLSAWGLSSRGTFGAHAADRPTSGSADRLFGRAKSVILLFLSGGPPQHETFDPKPNAPLEIRGPFQPISTNVPGIHFSELLPRTAAMADKLAVVRSLFTNNNIHGGSGYWVLTGRQLLTGDGETPRPDDWPFMGSMVKMLSPSQKLPALTSVTLPEVFIGNGGNLEAGQFGGFMGSQWNPEIITCNPAAAKFELSGQYTARMPAAHLRARSKLLEQFNQAGCNDSASLRAYAQLQQQAQDLLSSSGARRAFSLEHESHKTRDRYGREHWGQTVLLARRLVEEGVRFVTVNWPRVPGDRGVDNPLWDTHARNFDRMEDCLAPQFDIGFTALIEDLESRGLLADTLVVAVGEFGRTPTVNANGGRDHWGGVFSAVLAGAGIAGGQVFGASDKQGAYPSSDPVNAGHLASTIFHLLGIDPQGTFHDRAGRELSICDVPPLYKLFGEGPATSERVASSGDVRRVPPYTSAPLLRTGFELQEQLYPLDAPPNPKGWRAEPVLPPTRNSGLGITLLPGSTNRLHAGLGVFATQGRESPGIPISKAATAILAQQIRDPQAGRFIVTLQARGDGTDRKTYDDLFQSHFRCRLTLFQFANAAKTPAKRIELASIDIWPKFAAEAEEPFEEFTLDKALGHKQLGANFTFGLGIGVAVTVERKTTEILDWPPGSAAFIRIPEINVRFEGFQYA